MLIPIDYGSRRAQLEIADSALIPSRAAESITALADPAAALRAAIEQPLDFPPLRSALTPEDHVAVVVDERLPGLTSLLVPLLQHILSAGLPAEAVTLLC